MKNKKETPNIVETKSKEELTEFILANYNNALDEFFGNKEKQPFEFWDCDDYLAPSGELFSIGTQIHDNRVVTFLSIHNDSANLWDEYIIYNSDIEECELDTPKIHTALKEQGLVKMF